jgi:hypothetical protein
MGDVLKFPLTKEHLKFARAERLFRKEHQRVLDLEFATGKLHKPKRRIKRAYRKALRRTKCRLPD